MAPPSPEALPTVFDGLLERGVGIVQMPCPEQAAWGGVDRSLMLRLYGSRFARSRVGRQAVPWLARRWTIRRCRRIAGRVAKEINDYTTAGYDVTQIVGVGASPSCGTLTTLDLGGAITESPVPRPIL